MSPKKRKTPSDDPGQYLPLLAIAAANRARKPQQPLTRSEALAAAPWGSDMPAAWEVQFRKAYADRLLDRQLALPAKRSGKSGVSGANTKARRTLRASQQEFAEHDARAAAAGIDWTTWARRKLCEK